MLTCQMSVGEAVVAVVNRAWRSGRYETLRKKMEDIVRLSSDQRISARSEEKDHADTSETDMSGSLPLVGLYLTGKRLMVGCDWSEGSVMACI